MFHSTKEMTDELLIFYDKHMNGVRPAAIGVWVLLLLSRHPVSIPVIASRLQLSYETVKKYLAELMERGLVKQARAQGDGVATFRNANLVEMQDEAGIEGEVAEAVESTGKG